MLLSVLLMTGFLLLETVECNNDTSQVIASDQDTDVLARLNELSDKVRALEDRAEAFSVYIGNASTGPNLVGFTCKVTVDEHLPNLAAGSIVKFKTVMYNEGSGYDSSAGIFTAPTSGIYQFTFSIYTLHGTRANVLFTKNGITVTQAYSESLTDSHGIGGSNAVVCDLAAGDQVWLQTFEFDGAFISHLSAFTGVLIWSF